MKGKGRTLLGITIALAAMVMLVVASVPLYRLFCKVSGFGGTTRVAAGPAPTVSQKTMEIRFETTVMNGMPWRFEPVQTHMTVRLGEPNIAVFKAENLSDEPIAGTAVYNVTPAKAGPFVDKIQCFCFTRQTLGPHQTAELPVSFYIDPKIADDEHVNDVNTITLSYAFFKAKTQPKPLVSSDAAPSTSGKQLNEGAS